MRDIVYRKDLRYEDLDNPIEVRLILEGAWLYLETPIERITLNESALRYDGTPRNVLNYAINKHPGKLVERTLMGFDGIRTKRSLREIAVQAGIKGDVRELFVQVYDDKLLQIKNVIKVHPLVAEALVESLF